MKASIQSGDNLCVLNGRVLVNGKPFTITYPDEPLIGIDEDGKLITLFRGHLLNYWERSDIEGYWDLERWLIFGEK